MKKSKKFILFFSWIIFWSAFSFVWFYIFFENYIDNRSNEILLDTSNILNNIKDTLWNINIWWLSKVNENSDKFSKIWDILNSQYYYEDFLDKEIMIEAALKAFVEAVWDPYNVYLTTSENQLFLEWLEWNKDFEWIWAVVSKRQDWVFIDEIIRWAPAFNAWLKPHDLIIEINWSWTASISLTEAVGMIRWEKWTSVQLRVIRYNNWERDLFDVEVVRDSINVPSVRGYLREVSWANIWYIQISIFWNDTERALRDVIQWILEDSSNSLDWVILDLRWNGWWFLPMAVSIASYFLPEWSVVVNTNYKVYSSEEFKSRSVNSNLSLYDIPVVVLIDWLSASASEIIAAALRDWIWAPLVWKKSFWKWSIQTLYDFSDNSSLKYTIWAWYTPMNESVDNIWIEPDYEIEYSLEMYQDNNIDTQLEKAEEVILNLINN